METATAIGANHDGSGRGQSPAKACFDRLRALGLDKKDKPQHANLRRASVLVLLFQDRGKDDNENERTIHTLITKRSMNLRSHPGECCFPGGRQDEEDEHDDVQTALREAQEETGLDPKHVEVLGRLSTLESAGHMCVTSIIAKINDKDSSLVYERFMRDYAWKINPDEVDHAFGVPLAFFLEDPTSMFELEWSGEPFFMRVYDYCDPDSRQQFFVTGLTAHIAHEVARIAYAAEAKVVDVNDDQTASGSGDDMGNNNNSNNNNNTVWSGYLWKREVSSRDRVYWTKRYFVYSDVSEMATPFLHVYDSDDQAKRKSQAANKKNRLPLRGCNVTPVSESSVTVDGQSRFEFVISAVAGRIKWHMAAMSEKEREKWMRVLVQKPTDD